MQLRRTFCFGLFRIHLTYLRVYSDLARWGQLCRNEEHVTPKIRSFGHMWPQQPRQDVEQNRCLEKCSSWRTMFVFLGKLLWPSKFSDQWQNRLFFTTLLQLGTIVVGTEIKKQEKYNICIVLAPGLEQSKWATVWIHPQWCIHKITEWHI